MYVNVESNLFIFLTAHVTQIEYGSKRVQLAKTKEAILHMVLKLKMLNVTE